MINMMSNKVARKIAKYMVSGLGVEVGDSGAGYACAIWLNQAMEWCRRKSCSLVAALYESEWSKAA